MGKVLTTRLACAVFLAALFACAPEAGEKKVSIGYVVQDLGNQYWVAMAEGVKARAAELGWEATVLDTRTDPARELANTEDLIEKGVDYLLVSPWDPDTGRTVVEVANKAGIPVAILDIGVAGGEVDTFIISENYEGGRLAGEYVASLLGNQGKVASIESNPGYVIVALRNKGFIDVMNEKGIAVVARQNADGQRSLGMTVMQNMLQANPDLNAVFCMSDEAALGALEAVDAAGLSRKVHVVGFDGTSDALESIRQGGMTATVAQQPFDIGVMGVDAAARKLSGGSNPETTYVPVKLLTKKDL
ncbi:MAG: sugar ABC transporter substrate-binding protein [Planctomycetaceae bacterium]|nr:sugar ABC transporter substrate-binding protein [Planctomycetaceae bacterium]